jgi:hypothetical protein
MLVSSPRGPPQDVSQPLQVRCDRPIPERSAILRFQNRIASAIVDTRFTRVDEPEPITLAYGGDVSIGP